MTYKQARDKIIEAYFKNEINPMDVSFCFCGTLAGGAGWRRGDENYTPIDYMRMEHALLKPLTVNDYTISKGKFRWIMKENNETEERVFKGMSDALDVLRQIHIDRGEDVDKVEVFEKRKLVIA